MNGKKCVICGGDLTGRQVKYCSKKCLIKKGNIYNRNKNIEMRKKLKCKQCGKPLPLGKRKYCSIRCRNDAQNERDREKRKNNKVGEDFCIVCGEKLTTKQVKYCSIKCLEKDRVESGYYRRRYKMKREELKKVCIVCGKKLGRYKQKYCSYTCQRIKKNLWNSTPFEQDKTLPTYAPFYCDECGGRVIQERSCEYVCKDCGIVWGI